MKKKLKSNPLWFLITILLFFSSCNQEGYEEGASTFFNKQKNISDATEITEDIAKTVALNFYNRLKSDGIKESTVLSIKTIKDLNDQTAIYIVNIEPSGYVLVTSNSKNVPIAAYSKTGAFEFNQKSPKSLKGWILDNILFNDNLESIDLIKEINYQWHDLSEGRIPYPGDDNGEGESPNHTIRYSHTVNEQFGPFIETFWHQRYPYNEYTNGNPTGCVAVALAQIMRYHEWPNTFNWSIMPNDVNWVTLGSLEIASLMSDIGEEVDMSYSPTSSSASSLNAKNALINAYDYSSSVEHAPYSFNLVKNEIMYSRPVYMEGCHDFYTETTGWWFWEDTTQTNYNCHVWVCDGYKQQYDVYIHNEGTIYEYTEKRNISEFLHMNWGWGNNLGNGWYYKNYITNVNATIDGEWANYQYGRNIIYKIKK